MHSNRLACIKPALFSLVAIALTACVATPETLPYVVRQVEASVETDAMVGVGDRADDPALWVHPTDAGRSLILGSNKDAGVYVYSLDGAERQRLLVGNVNNVDVRGSVAVGSNDAVNGLSWFTINPATASVHHWGDTPVVRTEPYGVCLGVLDDRYVAGVTYKDGVFELWALAANTSAQPAATLSRSVQLDSQLEGCVFDDAYNRVFLGEEAQGIWVLDLIDATSKPQSVDAIANGNGLVADVEGLSLYKRADGSGFLVASAQEADRFVFYDRQPPYAVLAGIQISANDSAAIDAVTHTDGLDASAAALPGFPEGVLIVQDDGNPDSGVDQNFKIVDWRKLGL